MNIVQSRSSHKPHNDLHSIHPIWFYFIRQRDGVEKGRLRCQVHQGVHSLVFLAAGALGLQSKALAQQCKMNRAARPPGLATWNLATHCAGHG